MAHNVRQLARGELAASTGSVAELRQSHRLVVTHVCPRRLGAWLPAPYRESMAEWSQALTGRPADRWVRSVDGP